METTNIYNLKNPVVESLVFIFINLLSRLIIDVSLLKITSIFEVQKTSQNFRVGSTFKGHQAHPPIEERRCPLIDCLL